MKKRIFLGIIISDELKKKIAEFRQKYQDLPVRWLNEENLHITLMPPVELDDNEIIRMVEKLQKIKGSFGEFKINFNNISMGPNERRPRIIWIVGEKNNQLLALKNKITEVLGFGLDKRPFLPHLTIARFKPKDFGLLPGIEQKINWQERISSFSVIESECLEKGAVYTVLDNINL